MENCLYLTSSACAKQRDKEFFWRHALRLDKLHTISWDCFKIIHDHNGCSSGFSPTETSRRWANADFIKYKSAGNHSRCTRTTEMSYGGFWQLCCTGLLARLLDFLEPRCIKQSMQPECCIQREKPSTPETVNPGWTEQTPTEVRHSSLQVRTHVHKQKMLAMESDWR